MCLNLTSGGGIRGDSTVFGGAGHWEDTHELMSMWAAQIIFGVLVGGTQGWQGGPGRTGKQM